MELIQQASQELEARNFGTAIALLKRAVQQQPDSADAHRLLATAQYRAGDLGQAVATARVYAGLRPQEAEAHYSLGFMLQQAGDAAGAQAALRTALLMNPGHEQARALLTQLGGAPPAASPFAPAALPAVPAAAQAPGTAAAPAPPPSAFAPAGTPPPAPPPVAAPAPPPPAAAAPRPVPTAPPATLAPPSSPTDVAAAAQRVARARAQTRRRRVPLSALLMGLLVLVSMLAIAAAVVLPKRMTKPGPPEANPQDRNANSMVPPPNSPMAQAGQPGAQSSANSEMQPAPGTEPGQVQPSSTTGPNTTPDVERFSANARPDDHGPATTTGDAGRNPNRGTSSPQRGLFSESEASQVGRQANGMETGSAQGYLRTLSNWLRNDPRMQDADFWPIMQAAIATAGPSMVPGGPSVGSGEVMGALTNADTNFQAADNLDALATRLRSVLPAAVEAGIVATLSTANDADAAMQGIYGVLRTNNTQLSGDTLKYLQGMVNERAKNLGLKESTSAPPAGVVAPDPQAQLNQLQGGMPGN